MLSIHTESTDMVNTKHMLFKWLETKINCRSSVFTNNYTVHTINFRYSCKQNNFVEVHTVQMFDFCLILLIIIGTLNFVEILYYLCGTKFDLFFNIGTLLYVLYVSYDNAYSL